MLTFRPTPIEWGMGFNGLTGSEKYATEAVTVDGHPAIVLLDADGITILVDVEVEGKDAPESVQYFRPVHPDFGSVERDYTIEDYATALDFAADLGDPAAPESDDIRILALDLPTLLAAGYRRTN